MWHLLDPVTICSEDLHGFWMDLFGSLSIWLIWACGAAGAHCSSGAGQEEGAQLSTSKAGIKA